VEGVGDADHHVEKRADVDVLGDLRVGPTTVSEVLDHGVVDEVRVPRQRVDHRKELSLRFRHGKRVELARAKRYRRRLEFGSLRPQEVRMRAQSEMTTVEDRHVRRDHLVLSAHEVSVRELHR
jgi:hypothetical protein